MSQWIGSTNQKLYQCKLLLEQFTLAQQPALQQALEESALYQLRDAWLSYLHELADTVFYREPLSNFNELLNGASVVTEEIRELQRLLENSFSWLATMLAQAESIQKPKPRKKKQLEEESEEDAEPLVQRIDLIAIVPESSQSDVQFWWQKLNELVDSQRLNRFEI